MDLISIIVPIYKVEKYLNKCIESIVGQTYHNLEIILVDDGSPDNCPTMCDEWAEKDSRIKVIHKRNGGLSDARNAGLEIVTGKYVAFVDSDDWIERKFIENMYDAATETEADLVACEVEFLPDGEERELIAVETPDTRIYSSEEALEELIQGRGFRAVAWNKLYRTTLLEDERFAVGKLHEDEFFTYRIIDKARRLAFVNESFYNYRQRQGSIMKTTSIKHLDMLEAYLERLAMLEKKYYSLYRRDKVTFCIACLNMYENDNETKKTIKSYRKKVKFSWKEIENYSFRQKLYIIGSSTILIDIFSKIRMCKGFGKYD